MPKFWAEYIRCGNRVLNRQIDSYTSDRRHGVRCIADAQESGSAPSRQPVDCDRQKADLIPIAQLFYAVAQERRETCYFRAKRFQPSPADFVSRPFRDHEGTLPVVVAVEQDKNFPLVNMAKGLPRIIGTPADPHPHHIHGSAEINHFEGCPFANCGVAPIGAHSQPGPNFERAFRRRRAHSRHSIFFVDEVNHFRLHFQVKRGVALGLLRNKIQEIPLRHEGKKLAVSRQMREVRNRDCVLANLPSKLAYFLMRTLQEFIQKAELVHDIQRGWMDRVPAEIAHEIGMFFKYERIHAHARQKQPQHHAGRATSHDAATSVERFNHVYDNSNAGSPKALYGRSYLRNILRL